MPSELEILRAAYTEMIDTARENAVETKQLRLTADEQKAWVRAYTLIADSLEARKAALPHPAGSDHLQEG